MHRQKLSLEETETINRALNARISELDKTLSDVGKVASLITSYPAYTLTAAGSAVITRFDLIFVDSGTFIIVAMLTGDSVKNKLVHSIANVKREFLVKLGAVFNANFTNISEEKITEALILTAERAVNDKTGCVAIVAAFAIEVLTEAKQQRAHIIGASNLFDLPEYREAPKAQRLLRYLSNDSELLTLPTPESDGNVKITIGPENVAEELKDASVVVARQDIGSEMQVMVGVVGPTRMDYSKVASKLTYIAKGLSQLLAGIEPKIPQIGDK
jgi:heat-inducible transcriptional repressor